MNNLPSHNRSDIGSVGSGLGAASRSVPVVMLGGSRRRLHRKGSSSRTGERRACHELVVVSTNGDVLCPLGIPRSIAAMRYS